MCYPAAFHHLTESYAIQQQVPLLRKISFKPWENVFFIDIKLQSKIEVILINSAKFIILFIRDKRRDLFTVASVNTATASE